MNPIKWTKEETDMVIKTERREIEEGCWQGDEKERQKVKRNCQLWQLNVALFRVHNGGTNWETSDLFGTDWVGAFNVIGLRSVGVK